MFHTLTEQLVQGLSEFNPVVTLAPTGSVYVKFTGSKVKEVRISNHKGHKLSRNTWELRSDAMTSRKNPANRVYNSRDVKSLIKDFR